MKSNLTIEQQKLVRTTAFKKWFGDWENDPENSSKVVDENGEPLVVYHGSVNEFMEFDLEKTYRGGLGTGFYFTGQIEKAFTYGKNVFQVFIDIKNPIYVSGSNRESDLRDLLNITPLATETEVKNIVLHRGYDGVLVKRKGIFSEIVIFNNKKIKLADGTNTTFDTSNPAINEFINEYKDRDMTNLILFEDFKTNEQKKYTLTFTNEKFFTADNTLNAFVNKLKKLDPQLVHNPKDNGKAKDIRLVYVRSTLQHVQIREAIAEFVQKYDNLRISVVTNK